MMIRDAKYYLGYFFSIVSLREILLHLVFRILPNKAFLCQNKFSFLS